MILTRLKGFHSLVSDLLHPERLAQDTTDALSAQVEAECGLPQECRNADPVQEIWRRKKMSAHGLTSVLGWIGGAACRTVSKPGPCR